MRNPYGAAELVLGALFASVLWTGVSVWQASHAPSENEREACLKAARSVGLKPDECKGLLERTGSDPVALFTLVLAVSTIGLGFATVGLYWAGERQIEVARQSADAARLNAKALIDVERAHLYAVVLRSNLYDTLGSPVRAGDERGAADETRSAAPELDFALKNIGRSPAITLEAGWALVQGEPGQTVFEYPVAVIVNPVIDAGRESGEVTCSLNEAFSVGAARAALREDRPLYFIGYVRFMTTFDRRYEYRWRYQNHGAMWLLSYQQEWQL